MIIVDDVDDNDEEFFCFVIEDCEVGDFGIYKVVVMSEVGIINCECSLNVICI